jgi:hypothetical protein
MQQTNTYRGRFDPPAHWSAIKRKVFAPSKGRLLQTHTNFISALVQADPAALNGAKL